MTISEHNMEHHHSLGGRVRRRSRVIGVGSTAAAFLAFGMAPLGAAPGAHADGFDWLLDMFEPSDVAGVAADTSGVDGVFGDSPFWDQLLLANPALDPASVIEQWMYAPWHTAMESWITSDLGQQINDAINLAYVQMNGVDSLNGACGLICNGVDGTETDPDGGAGGLWFGDGGDGWDSTMQGVAGGDGGAAGFFGNGGAGGDGWASTVAGVDGGVGGAGGTGGTVMG
ncbi:MAG: PGRS repeat-containing protein, partial [Mycobacterium sp.]